MDPARPLYEGGPAFLEPELLCSPASAPTGGREEAGAQFKDDISPGDELPRVPYFSQGGLLVPKPNDEDAVGLADAALGPGGHSVVGLVQDNPIDVLLLGQPAGETVLMDAEEVNPQQCVIKQI